MTDGTPKTDTPETILTNVVAVLEKQTSLLQQQQQAIEQLFRETAEIKQRLDKLESADSLDSDDAKFVKDVTARLTAISTTLTVKNITEDSPLESFTDYG